MKISDLIVETWSPSPLDSLPTDLDLWDKHYANMIVRYDDVKNASTITAGEAAMLIAADKQLSEAIFSYKYANRAIPSEVENKLVDIVKRVKPIDKTFYRGVEHENYDNKHIMKLQSWSLNTATAKMFGDTIYKSVGKVQGFEVSEVYYWYGLLTGDSDGLGDSQAEWLLLPPEMELLD